MSPTTMNGRPQNSPTRGRWIYVCAGLLLLYMISYGPMAVVMYSGWMAGPSTRFSEAVRKVLRGVYYPHEAVALRRDTYNRYTAWWISLVDEKSASAFGAMPYLLSSFEDLREYNRNRTGDRDIPSETNE